MQSTPKDSAQVVIGWREWIALPALSIPAIKVKADTGARTSALHAFYAEPFRHHQRAYVRFGVHPLRGRRDLVVVCTCALLDQREVSDSGGHRERRWVIETPLRLGDAEWPVEMTLTDRDSMLFRMLLGRTAMVGRVLVDPTGSYLVGKKPDLEALYGRSAAATAPDLVRPGEANRDAAGAPRSQARLPRRPE